MGLTPLLDYSEWDPRYKHQQELVDWFNGIQLAISDTYDREWVWYLVDNKWYKGWSTITQYLSVRNPFTILSIAVDWWDPDTKAMFTRTFKMVNPYNGKNEVQSVKTFTPPEGTVGILKPWEDPTKEHLVKAKGIIKGMQYHDRTWKTARSSGGDGGETRGQVGARGQEVPDPFRNPYCKTR